MKPCRIVCCYHDSCIDGFASAWVVRQHFDNLNLEVTFVPAKYGSAPPDVKDCEVFIVDFSYKRDVLLQMAKEASHITILDHHKTAAEDLKDLPTNVEAIFDMQRSGARITWDYFFPRENPPQLLLHIEDRDLWRFALSRTREINAALFSYPYDFNVWDQLMSQHPEALYTEGVAIERKHSKDIKELLPSVTRRMIIGGYNVPVANLPYIFSSDAGYMLARGDLNGGVPEPFAACYMDGPDGRVFSFRSTDTGVDVSEIAKALGGGGHRNASGAKVSYTKAAEFELASFK